jgi:hypothetical protein
MTLDSLEMSSNRPLIAALIELASVDKRDWDSTVQQILRLEARVLDVERLSFWTVRDDEKVLYCEMAYHRTTGVYERGSKLMMSEHADLLEALGKAAPLDVQDVGNDRRLKSLRDYFSAREVSSLLAFPIRPHGRLAGLLCLEHVGPQRRWNESDEGFAAAVAIFTEALGGRIGAMRRWPALALSRPALSEVREERVAHRPDVIDVVLRRLSFVACNVEVAPVALVDGSHASRPEAVRRNLLHVREPQQLSDGLGRAGVTHGRDRRMREREQLLPAHRRLRDPRPSLDSRVVHPMGRDVIGVRSVGQQDGVDAIRHPRLPEDGTHRRESCAPRRERHTSEVSGLGAEPPGRLQRAVCLPQQRVEASGGAEGLGVGIRRDAEVHAHHRRVDVGALEVVLLKRRDSVKVDDEVVVAIDGMKEARDVKVRVAEART